MERNRPQTETSNEKQCDNQTSSLVPSDCSDEDNKKISDVVAFSLCSLCAIKLRSLYPEEYHNSFHMRTLNNIVKYLKLPDRAAITIDQFTPDDEFTFLLSIKQNHSSGSFKIIEELLLLSLSTGLYDARSHYLIIDVAESLGVPRELVELHCESIYYLLLKSQQSKANDEEDEETSGDTKKTKKSKVKKYFAIGLASLGGGAIIGLTGGLAAPIVASALGAVVGANFIIGSAAAGVVGTIFGVAGAGLTASKMDKRIGDLEQFSFHSLNPAFDQTSLTITIAISGWISSDTVEGFSLPWKYLRHTKEQYVLCYESKYLLEWSQAMDYLLSLFVSFATQEVLKYTFLSSVMAAIAWPAALISMANIIDNPWDVCVERSEKAGKHLAHVLKSHQQGKRPASLIGFSLGARVIFYCLQELSQQPDCEGIIGDVIMLGAPVTASEDQWKSMGRVVCGRLINGYSTSDWLLKFLYRSTNAVIRVAGLQPVAWDDRRLKNVDLTSIVDGHLDYYKKINEILRYVNVKVDPNYAEHRLLVQSADMTSSSVLKLEDAVTTNGIGANNSASSVYGNDKNQSNESQGNFYNNNKLPSCSQISDQNTAAALAMTAAIDSDNSSKSRIKAMKNIDMNALNKTTGDKSRLLMPQVMGSRVAREQARQFAARYRRSGSLLALRVHQAASSRKFSADLRGPKSKTAPEVSLGYARRSRSGSI